MAQAEARAKQPAPPRRRRGSATPRKLPYLLIAPAGLLMLGFIAYPVLSVFYYSLQDYNPTKPWRNGFAGFDNFVHSLHRGPAVLGHAGLQRQVGRRRGRTAAAVRSGARADREPDLRGGGSLGRAMVFSPWAVSGVLTSAIWVLLYNSQTGITRYLADMGIGDYGTSWLSDTSTVFPAVVVADLCGGVSFFAHSSSSPTSSPSRRTCTRPPRSTAPAGSGSSCTSRCRTSRTRSSSPRCCARSGSSTTSTCSTRSPAADRLGTTTTLPLYIANTSVDAHNFGYASALTTVAFVILLFCSMVYLRLSKFGRWGQVITKDVETIAPAVPAPVAEGSPSGRGKRRRAWDEAPRWQIYLPLGIYLLFTLIPFYWILLFALQARPARPRSCPGP